MKPIYASLRHPKAKKSSQVVMLVTDFEIDLKPKAPIRLSPAGKTYKDRAVLEYLESLGARTGCTKLRAKDVVFRVELDTEQQIAVIRNTEHGCDYKHVLARREALTKKIAEHEEHIRQIRQDLREDKEVDKRVNKELSSIVKAAAYFESRGL